MKKFLAFFIALALASVSIFSLAASAAYYTPEQFGIDCEYMGKYGSTNLSSVPFGSLLRVAVGNDLVEAYQPGGYIKNGTVSQFIVEKYGLYNHILDSSKTISIGAWKIVYSAPTSTSDGSLNYSFEVFLNGVSMHKESGFVSSDGYEAGTFRYGFILCNINETPYIWFVPKSIQQFKTANYQSNTNYDLLDVSADSNILNLPDFTRASKGYLLKATAGGSSFKSEVDLEGGQTVEDVSVKGALTCPSCGSKNVTLIPQPMYDVGSEGGLIYKIRCNDCQDYWHWTFTRSEKELIEQLKNDPESGFQITFENAVSDNLGDIFDLPRDENGNVIWGDAAGNFGELMTGTFNGLSSAAVSVVSIFGTIFSFLPEGILALISFAIILCCFIGIFKTLRG